MSGFNFAGGAANPPASGGFSFAGGGANANANNQAKPGGFGAMTNFGGGAGGGAGGFGQKQGGNMFGGGGGAAKPMGNMMGTNNGGGNMFGGGAAKPMGNTTGNMFGGGGGGGFANQNNMMQAKAPMLGAGGINNNTNNANANNNPPDSAAIYLQITRHPDGMAALQKLAKVDWAYHGAKENGKGHLSGQRQPQNFPFQYMFYDNLVTWESDAKNGKAKYVKKSDSNQGKQSMNANLGGANVGFGGGGAFGGAFGAQNNNVARQGQNMMNNGGSAQASFKNLWNAAFKGQQAGGISHEEFILRAVQDHMKGPMGEYRFISDKLWEEAESNAVINGVKVFPHPIIGFEQLKARIQDQRER